MTPTIELVELKVLRMPCCGHLLCWVNPRYPTYCPECGKLVYPEVKKPDYHVLHAAEARLVY